MVLLVLSERRNKTLRDSYVEWKERRESFQTCILRGQQQCAPMGGRRSFVEIVSRGLARAALTKEQN